PASAASLGAGAESGTSPAVIDFVEPPGAERAFTSCTAEANRPSNKTRKKQTNAKKKRLAKGMGCTLRSLTTSRHMPSTPRQKSYTPASVGQAPLTRDPLVWDPAAETPSAAEIGGRAHSPSSDRCSAYDAVSRRPS